MTQLFGLYLLWFGLLLLQFSCQLREDFTRTRKLCGRYLVKEIEKLCGTKNWSQFQLEEETPVAEVGEEVPQASEKVEAYNPENFKSPQTPVPTGGRVTNPASTSTSRQEAISGLGIQSTTNYQYKKVDWLPEKTKPYFSSHDVNPNIEDSVQFQKESTNKIKPSHSLFWGNHPQRKRRGFSNKCCLKGCTKGELAIACLPYIDF